jgi:hypothetical protein
LEMKMLQRRARPRCPIKRHDVKWPCDPPRLSHFSGARRCRERSLQSLSAYRRNLVCWIKFEPDVDGLSRGSGQAVRWRVGDSGLTLPTPGQARRLKLRSTDAIEPLALARLLGALFLAPDLVALLGAFLGPFLGPFLPGSP